MPPEPASAPPFPIAPRLVREHVRRATLALGDAGADGLLIFRGTNILAFTGVPLEPSDRLVCALLNRDGRLAFVVPAFEADIVRGLPAGSVIVSWHEDEDPYAAAAEAARALGLAGGRILLDGRTWIDAHMRLSQALAGTTLSADTGVIDAVRTCKSAGEIAAIRAACRDTGRIYPAMSDLLKPGVSELEALATAQRHLRSIGISPWGDLIQGGPNAAIPHQRTGRRRFQPGDAVIVDFVAQREGYLGDMTRTFALGRVSDEVRHAYHVVRDAQRAAIEAIQPGVPCEAVDAAARAVIDAAGLGDFFTHRTGHGIGLDVHEPPFIVRGNAAKLAPGMVFTIEPGVYVPGRFGIRIEDVIAVTESGHDILSDDTPTDVSPEFTREVLAA